MSVRVRLLAVVAVALAVVGVLAVSGMRENLVYYKTPSELVADPELKGERVRLGGLVAAGSVRNLARGVSFTVTDGVTDIRVVYPEPPRGVFAEGQGALVGGVWGQGGVFHADELMVKHSNEYRGSGGTPYSPPSVGGGERR